MTYVVDEDYDRIAVRVHERKEKTQGFAPVSIQA